MVPSSADCGPILVLMIAVRLYRDGLAHLLSNEAGMTVHSAEDDGGAIRLATSIRPDIVLLDTRFSRAFTILHSLRDTCPRTRVIALGIDDEDQEVVAWAEAGVSGYVVSDATFETLVATIRSVTKGELLCSPRIAALLLRQVATSHRNVCPDGTGLTRRELEIMTLIDEGAANKEIASRLHVELSTVKNHIHHILVKLGATSRLQAAARVRALATRRTPKGFVKRE